MRDFSGPIKEFEGKSFAELEIIEHPESGHLMFPDVLRSRGKKGELVETPVRVRICRTPELIELRGQTRILFRNFKGLEEERDQDVFRELEQLTILSRSIRTFKAPYPQMAEPIELGSTYDSGCLEDILGRITALRQMLDPRASELTEGELWELIHSVAARSTILPLTGIAGFEQPSCLHFMARHAMCSPTGLSWLQSRGILTAGSSPTSSSE
jgi:hypothetical protein